MNIVFKAQKQSCNCPRGNYAWSPHDKGGTCWFAEQVLVYKELKGEVKIEGGRVYHREILNATFVDLYCTCRVAGLLADDGTQVYP